MVVGEVFPGLLLAIPVLLVFPDLLQVEYIPGINTGCPGVESLLYRKKVGYL